MIFTELLIKASTSFLQTLLIKVATKEMVSWAFFKIADSVVASTSTTHDDEWLNKIKEEYNKQ